MDFRKLKRLGYDIRGDGHAITGMADRLMTVPKIEMTDGKLFNSQKDRLHVLALLLESVGIDAAVRLGPPELWRQAIAGLDNETTKKTIRRNATS